MWAFVCKDNSLPRVLWLEWKGFLYLTQAEGHMGHLVLQAGYQL